MVQPLGSGHRHQCCHLASAARLSKDRDQVRITPEVSDVVAHPLERRDYVQYSRAARESEIGARLFTQVGKAEHVQAMIDADHYDVASTRQVGAFDNRARA